LEGALRRLGFVVSTPNSKPKKRTKCNPKPAKRKCAELPEY
jgi:hypothetical protein